MQENDAVVPLTDGDEAICAFFIENPYALLRVVRMMPHGNPTLDFLQKLWSYAVLRNRKVDLANALLAHDTRTEYPQIKLSRDWYRECHLPSRCPEFFNEVERYAWTRAEVEAGEYVREDIDAIEADLDTMEDIKESIGDGIIDMESTLTKIRLRRNVIIRDEQRLAEREKRSKTAKKEAVNKPKPTCILNIHREYCDRILAGEKTYEYRKRYPEWIAPGCEMVLCSSDDPAVLLAVFEVGKIVTGTPEEVWERTCKTDGVERDAFLKGYYENEPQAVAFEILNPRPISGDKTVASIFGPDYVPHSFKRLYDEEIAKVQELMKGE